jgi:hypothetical protein
MKPAFGGETSAQLDGFTFQPGSNRPRGGFDDSFF